MLPSPWGCWDVSILRDWVLEKLGPPLSKYVTSLVVAAKPKARMLEIPPVVLEVLERAKKVQGEFDRPPETRTR